jgi:hypothetical protein
VRERHYSPQLSRLVVCALYHEAKYRQIPMTRLADELLLRALKSMPGMVLAEQQLTSVQPDCSTTAMPAVHMRR